jgi:hypothetical protein
MKEELLIKKSEIMTKPTYVTFKIIRKIYLWFGFTEEDIPFLDIDENKSKYIDIEQIKKL